jgi:hypothetical protein
VICYYVMLLAAKNTCFCVGCVVECGSGSMLWIRILITLQMTSQNVWNISLFEHLLQGVEPLCGSWDPDPDPHQGEKSDPDPNPTKIRIRIRIK